MAKVSYRQIPDLVAGRHEFDGNSMHAENVKPGAWVRNGLLPDEEVMILDHSRGDAKHFGEDLYVVYSYGTPIAWGMAGRELYVPDVKYSATTSRQQAICRRNVTHTITIDA